MTIENKTQAKFLLGMFYKLVYNTSDIGWQQYLLTNIERWQKEIDFAVSLSTVEMIMEIENSNYTYECKIINGSISATHIIYEEDGFIFDSGIDDEKIVLKIWEFIKNYKNTNWIIKKLE